MENTYGYMAINRWTFNQDPRYLETIKPKIRENILFDLRINNWVLNFFGYLNSTRVFSGQIRIFIGLCVLTGCSAWTGYSLIRRQAINRFAVEGILTAITQIFRGYVEAFLIYGRLINASLDVIFTPINIIHNSRPKIPPREGELKQL